MPSESFGLTYEMVDDLYEVGGRLLVFDSSRRAYRKSPGATTAQKAWSQLVRHLGGHSPEGLLINDATGVITYDGRAFGFKISVP